METDHRTTQRIAVAGHRACVVVSTSIGAWKHRKRTLAPLEELEA